MAFTMHPKIFIKKEKKKEKREFYGVRQQLNAFE